jgi:hypothetical protein
MPFQHINGYIKVGLPWEEPFLASTQKPSMIDLLDDLCKIMTSFNSTTRFDVRTISFKQSGGAYINAPTSYQEINHGALGFTAAKYPRKTFPARTTETDRAMKRNINQPI